MTAVDLEVRCPDCNVDASRLPPCRVCGHPFGCCPCVHADEAVTHRPLDMGDCTCLYSCGDDPAEGCSLSGREWHVHPQDDRGVTGPCPVHPDAPGDL